jgi:hypothetical protein
MPGRCLPVDSTSELPSGLQDQSTGRLGLFTLGESYMQSGRHRRARKCYHRYLLRFHSVPDLVVCYFNLSRIYHNCGDTRIANGLMKKAIEAEAGNISSNYKIAKSIFGENTRILKVYDRFCSIRMMMQHAIANLEAQLGTDPYEAKVTYTFVDVSETEPALLAPAARWHLKQFFDSFKDDASHSRYYLLQSVLLARKALRLSQSDINSRVTYGIAAMLAYRDDRERMNHVIGVLTRTLQMPVTTPHRTCICSCLSMACLYMGDEKGGEYYFKDSCEAGQSASLPAR